MNEKQEMSANQRTAAYVSAWNNLFSILCGWPASRVHDWVVTNKYHALLQDAKSMIFHRPPQYWVINYIVQDEAITHLSGPSKADLIQDLMFALKDEQNFAEGDSLDSKVIRSKVNEILKPHRVTLLPKVTPHYDSSDVFRIDNHKFATARNFQRSEQEKTRVLESVH